MSCPTCTTATLRAFIASFAYADTPILQRSFCITGIRTRRSVHTSPALRMRASRLNQDISSLVDHHRSSSSDDTYIPFDSTSDPQHCSLPCSLTGLRRSGIAFQKISKISPGYPQQDDDPEITILDPNGVDSNLKDGPISVEVKAIFDHRKGPSVTAINDGAESRPTPPAIPKGHQTLKETKIVKGNNRASHDRETWQVQKQALTEKFGSTGWAPRKRLSPDALEGIRALHAQYPEKYTTPELAQHFEVSAEAIRRILKSKWKPNEEEETERRKRWDKRGEAIWGMMVEIGIKPPKKWRQMGVGKDHVPLHKRKGRSATQQRSVAQQDTEYSARQDWSSSQIVASYRRPNGPSAPLSERIL